MYIHSQSDVSELCIISGTLDVADMAKKYLRQEEIRELMGESDEGPDLLGENDQGEGGGGGGGVDSDMSE